MQCCGEPFSVGSPVSWTVVPPDRDYLASVLGEREAERVTDAEEHHGVDNGHPSSRATGVVQTIEAVACRFARSGIDSRALHPVAGTAVVTSLTTADGWESDAALETEFVGLAADWPVLDAKFGHREVFHVGSGERGADGDCRGSDQAVGLMERDAASRMIASPGSREDPFGGAEWRDAKPSEQSVGGWFFVWSQAPPDFLDRDCAAPWFVAASAQLRDTLGRWSSS